jgi:chromosome partitioning protein
VRIIALFNQSGGVGKTTLTMNLGYHLAELGRKVLLVDMDPQASLTVFMGVDSYELEATVYDAIVRKQPLPVLRGIHRMDLAPANINLSKAEQELAAAVMREQKLKKALEPVLSGYDFLLIDCPPSLGILSIMSLVAATHILIPIQTEFKALNGTRLVLQTFLEVVEAADLDLRIAGFIPTMLDTRTAQGTDSLKVIEQDLPKIGTVHPAIPRVTDFVNASQAHQPFALYSPKHRAVQVLQEIAQYLDNL